MSRRIHLCGELRLEADGTVVEGRAFPGRQARLVFSYLVINRGRPVTRDELAGVLWSGTPPAGWERKVSVIISRLRAVVGGLPTGAPVLTTVLGCYQLRPAPDTVVDGEEAEAEVEAAEASLREGDVPAAAPHAQRAAALGRQPFLAGDDSAWVVHVRDARRRLVVRALDVGVEAAMAMGDPARAVALAEEAVAVEPHREAGHEKLVEVLSRTGDRVRAMQAQQRLSRLLAEELGIAPAHDTDTVSGGPPPPRAREQPSTHLPPPPLAAGHVGAVFVGRRVEITMLHDALHEVGRGGPGVVLVHGEAGIGKTALAIHFGLEAHRDGADLLAGRCDRETPAPYRSFVEALRHAVTALPVDELRACVGRDGPQLVRLLPGLADRMALVPEPVADPDTERYRLFEAVAGLLRRLTRDRTLVMVLEDVQWAQPGTLQLIRHLARLDRPLSLLVVATYRTDVPPSRQVAELLSDLRRDDLAVEITMGGLLPEEVRSLIGSSVSDRDLSLRIAQVTAGNPLFVREFARHLQATGGTGLVVPQSVREVIGWRLESLSRAAVETLTLAAVVGREFDLEVLSTVGHRSDDAVLADLEEAGRAGIVAEVPGAVDRWSFSHAVVREALYAEISASRRTRLHRAIGEALVELVEDPTARLGEIARHLHAAETAADRLRALAYARQAGDQSMAEMAFETAAEQYELAVSCLREEPGAVDTPLRCQLLLSLADARRRTGDPRTGSTYLMVITRARRSEPGCGADCFARAAIGAAAALRWTAEVDMPGVELLEEALHRLGPEDGPLRAEVLGRLAGKLYHLPETAERRDALSTEAVAMARRLGDPVVLATCLDARNYAVWGPGGATERLAVGSEIVGLAERAGDRELALRGHAWCAIAMLETGDPGGLEAALTAYESTEAPLRVPHHRWYALSRRAMRLLLAGDLDGGELLARRATEVGWHGHHLDVENVLAIQLVMVWRERPDAGAVQYLGEGCRVRDSLVDADSMRALAWHAMRAHVALELGDLETVRAEVGHLVGRGLERLERGHGWIGTLAFLAPALARVGDPGEVAAAYRLLLPHAGSNAQASGAAAYLGSVSHHLGVLATRLERRADAERHFAAAAAMHERMAAAPSLARTHLEWATMLAAGRRPQDLARARDLARAATALARSLGLRSVDGRAAALLERLTPG
ncbi:MAG TPA: AAA family ATPase [Candidatus Dormibacteraeota bacterium]|nr:AAA family ATPase [Candidatus Dormibacteraeota bacterium]